jgi:[histone H3]-lysine9 N-trimethyltransferase SUV39H
VAWSTWKRADGSNTTWMPDLFDRPDLVKSWKRKQNQRRRELAEESLDIEVLNTIDIHNANTVRRAQVLLDKTHRRKGRMLGYKQWDLELEKNLDRLDREMGVGTEGWSRSLRGNSSRTHETPFPKAPSSVISISESSSSSGSKNASLSRASPSSSSRSTTLSSAPMARNPPTNVRQSLSPQSPIIEPRPSRPLPRRVMSLTPAKPKPSQSVVFSVLAALC